MRLGAGCPEGVIEVAQGFRLKAWFIARSGPLAGTRYPLPDGVTRIGRSLENDIVVQPATVSVFHAEVSKNGEGASIRDSDSTNGTYLNGERIGEAKLTSQEIVRLGKDGPEFGFVVEDVERPELDRTLMVQQGIVLRPAPAPPQPAGEHDALLSEAVTQARRARAEGAGDQTMNLMRSVLRHALRRSRKRLRVWIYLLAAALALVSAYGYLRTSRLKTEKASVDSRIQDIETRLANAEPDPQQMEGLLSQLDAYQDRAESLRRNVLYRLSVHDSEASLTRQIRALMAEFGAEVYSIPPDFVERVNHYIQQYQDSDRPLMERALNQLNGKVEIMRSVLEQEKLPPDLAYIPLVESTLAANQASAAGASGPWQLTAGTARACGLRVDGQVDQRNELRPSTRAACRYLRELILDFGAGSSVMLALAAYNLGPARVKQAITKNVRDPIKQRNFWYLYRARALPLETREYVPKVFAAILIGRDPKRFGF
jgi:pSer/pThr/pTyr-binding forkhead associated (FHA) protein